MPLLKYMKYNKQRKETCSMKNNKLKIALSVLLASILILGFGACSSGGNKELEVYFFQAGKADAILLTTENHTVLIDCGLKGFGSTILDYLEDKGIEKIDTIIITHFDKDHVGGAAKVINNIEVGEVLQSNCPKDSDEYDNYINALAAAGLDAKTVTREIQFTYDGITFNVNPPASDDYDEDESNNSSLIVTVTCGENTLLFMGDAQTERLKEYLAGKTADCDIIKIPHHGGEDELMDELIERTSPDYAVITCSDDEPDTSDTENILSDASVTIFKTSVAPVYVKCTENSLSIEYVY